MQKRRTLKALIAASLLAGFTTAAPLATAAEDIVIGAVLPLSGGSATIGNQTRTGLQIAIDQINAAGGITSKGGAKIRLIFADSQSRPDVGASETERLIQSENVAALVGAYNSAVTFPASEVAERYKTPWLVSGSVKNEITERNFRYIFRPGNKATYDAREQLDAITLLKEETGKGPQRLGLFYEGTDWGRSHAAVVKQLAKEQGYDIVLDEAFPPNQMDFTAQLLKIRSTRPEALIIAAYPSDHILFNKQLHQNRINLPYGLHSVGGGAEDPGFYKAVPQAAIDYMFVQEDAQVDRLKTETDPLVLAANAAFHKALGYDINSYGAHGYSGGYILADVLERAKSSSREDIRNALASTNITTGPALMNGYQRIAFDEHGQNVDAHGVISQNLNGERLTIWPRANRADTTQPVWPVPDWNQR
ncbi:ABC transporter substrate-binding protein [Kerstersia similis]|uniref:ABC transporter substrate-binding protein n=1 Tax=Kerstersia similis TaxID=206505 RepID=UPI0039EF47D7